jgi:L-threonylcarbamoyladenylate synthase
MPNVPHNVNSFPAFSAKNIFAAAPRPIRRAARLIRAGELVAFPTETVYGLGANALDARAVARIFEVKGRPRFNPLIVHVAAREDALKLWKSAPASADRLMDRFWPGPLTLVLPKSDVVPDIVTTGLDTVAVRIPAHPVALDLLRFARRPVAAPSANVFGRSSPTTAQAVSEEIGGKVAMILDAGVCPIGIESTVVSLTGGAARILRIGGTTIEDLKKALGDRVRVKIAAEPGRPRSPGMLERHYAPAKPLFIVKLLPPPRRAGIGRRNVIRPLSRSAFLAFEAVGEKKAFSAVEVLSASGNLAEAAANFFAALRRLSGATADFILAEEVPEQGLGFAIMDRLRRAASGTAAIDWETRSAALFPR